MAGKLKKSPVIIRILLAAAAVLVVVAGVLWIFNREAKEETSAEKFSEISISEPTLSADATDEERWIYAYKMLSIHTIFNGADFITHSEEERQNLKNALHDVKTPNDLVDEDDYHFVLYSDGCGGIGVDNYDPYNPGQSVSAWIQSLKMQSDPKYYPKGFPCHTGDSLDEVLEALKLRKEMIQDLSYLEISGEDLLEGVWASHTTDGRLRGISFIRKDNTAIGLEFSFDSDSVLETIRFSDFSDYSEKEEDLLSDLSTGESSAYSWNSGKQIETGDIITFGVYEQDNDLDNGLEEIMWHVAYSDGNEALLVSSKGLDFVDYDESAVNGLTWSGSTIRNWLRTDFYTQAFSEEEQNAILTKTLETKDSITGDIETSEDTVFILSAQEAETYLDSSQKSILVSDYAKSKCDSSMITACGSYYRSYDTIGQNAEGADEYGECRPYMCKDPLDYSPPVAVRPAVWINLKR